MSKKRESLRKLLLLVAVLLLILSCLIVGLWLVKPEFFAEEQLPQEQAQSKTIVRDGVEYFPRQDITVMLVMGIDQFGPVQDSGSYRNTGSADMVMLLIFDEVSEELNILYLNRDTMLQIPVLGLGGKQAGTTFAQLALAHTYGSGLEDSCENVKNTLMQNMHGLHIDYYLAMNMDAIPILNDAVGGVTVTVKDDFSKINPSITMGELTLRGDQVIDYVRTRKDVGDQKNVTRMQRQREYVDAFLEALYESKENDPQFLVSTYEQVTPYIVTDCTANNLSSMLDRYTDYAINEAVTPEGENLIIDGYYQFHADEENMDALILELFYRPKK